MSKSVHLPTKTGHQPAVHRDISELALLFEIIQTLERSVDLRDVMGTVLDLIARDTGMVRGTVTLLNRETGEIYIDEAHGLSPSQRATCTPWRD